jgi:hypothetical protein
VVDRSARLRRSSRVSPLAPTASISPPDRALVLLLVCAFAAAVVLLVWPDLLPMALGRPRLA